jgi:hypothetical protein
MLTKLRVAIDIIDAALEGDELIFEVLRFVFLGVVFAAMAIPKEIAGQGPFSRLTLTLSLSSLSPISRPPWHRLGRESLSGLVNQS